MGTTIVSCSNGYCTAGLSSGKPTLYRAGDGSSPALKNIHTQENPYGNGRIDIPVDADGNVHPHSGGMSSVTQPLQRWKDTWAYPSGAKPPRGITIVNDKPGHWRWEPSWEMSKTNFVDLLYSTLADWIQLD
ncbi:MAG: hypothetical protein ACOYZ6_04175 [Chloroflexota bacterium]